MRRSLVSVFVLSSLLLAGLWAYLAFRNTPPAAEPVVASFDDCVSAGNPVMESYPRQCQANGITYTEEVSPPPGPDLANELIVVASPSPNSEIQSPLTIIGQARGTWYFEASFPVELRNAEGTVIAQKPAQAKSDWMTTNFVSFEIMLTFPVQTPGSTGSLILRKDNPSGLPENENFILIPVIFK